jgi:cytidyltransferase-like protein
MKSFQNLEMVKREEPILIVSGGFDPLHEGHIKMIEDASKLGQVIVIVNTDKFLLAKKGFYFQNESLRALIMQSLKNVHESIISIDQDMTVNSTLTKIRENHPSQKLIFANGGDRVNKDCIPEYPTCKNLNIEMAFNIGGEKINSSSKIFEDAEAKFFQATDPLKNIDIKKPWGRYKNLFKNKDFLIKVIIIHPGAELSRQYHEHRKEVWIMLRGKLFLQIGNESITLLPGDYIGIDKENIHYAKNYSDSDALFAEVQLGDKISEGDIVRVLDRYHR